MQTQCKLIAVSSCNSEKEVGFLEDSECEGEGAQPLTKRIWQRETQFPNEGNVIRVDRHLKGEQWRACLRIKSF